MDFDDVYRTNPDGGYYGPPEPDFLHCLSLIEGLTGVGTAVDLACGDGRFSRLLCARGWRADGVDTSRDGLVSASGACGSLFRAIHADAQGFDGTDYDLVVAGTYLDHLSPQSSERALNHLKTHCRPGGFVYVTVFNSWDPENPRTERKYQGLAEKGSETGSAVVKFFDIGQLVSAFSDWQVLHYSEQFSLALHSPPHSHGLSIVCARRPDRETTEQSLSGSQTEKLDNSGFESRAN